MLNGTNIAVEQLSNESKTGFSQMHRSSVVTLESGSSLVTPQAIRDWLMLSRQDSLASRLVLQVNSKRQKTIETCGPKQLRLFDSSDPLLSFSKTFPDCSLVDMPQPLPATYNGLVIKYYHHSSSVLMTLALPTKETEFGSWPTPAAHDSTDRTQFNPVITSNGTVRHANKAGTQSRASLSQIVKMWPTPRASDGMTGKLRSGVTEHNSRLEDAVAMVSPGGYLNPEFVEWLMGWPIGWSALEPLATDKCHSAQHWHFSYWLEVNREALRNLWESCAVGRR